MTALLDDLSPEQRYAVTFSGPALLVTAGPGSGKTRVVTHRIVHQVIQKHVQPTRIVAVTFTNRAAREMHERVESLLDGRGNVPIGTFHWMCAGILRRRISVLGYRSDFKILQPRDSRRALQTVLLRDRSSSQVSLSSLTDAMSGLKSGASPERLVERTGISIERLHRFAFAYRSVLRRTNALDLDDLPFLAATLLREHPTVRDRCRSAIDELLVDEYQDTNAVQQELVALLAPAGGTVVVVGDEDQAIYGWRYADSRGFKRFQHGFPAAEVVTLQRSYRHHKFAARAANALIARNPNRSSKSIQTELPAGRRPVCFAAAHPNEEANWIADEIARLVSTERFASEDIAVVYRINAQSRVLEDSLFQRAVPYRVLSGRSFYDRPHVQTVLAYLRLAIHRDDDVAATRLLKLIRGMGDRRISELQNWATVHQASLVTALSSTECRLTFPTGVNALLHELAGRIDEVGAVRKRSIQAVVSAAIRVAGVDLEAQALLTETVLEDFEELRAVAREHMKGRRNLRFFAESLSLDKPTNGQPVGVNLMSLHSAKGLEYRVVFMCGLEEGVLPHARALPYPEDIEEERRLCYVGMTRARELLYLSYARSRESHGNGAGTQPSRFIGEIGLQNITLKVSTAQRIEPRTTNAGAGDRIRHPRWGAGTIERVDTSGRDAMATVVFDTTGRKTVQLTHVPVSRIHKDPGDVSAG